MTSDETIFDEMSTNNGDETAVAAAETTAGLPKSYLIADCGHTNTTVALFDQAAGSYRLIARATVPTTAAEPWNDIHVGIYKAVEEIAALTKRQLLNQRGDLIRPGRASGTGVDAFAVVVSAAPPLETILAGLFDKVSLVSARRILNSVYAREVDNFNLADSRSENEQISSIVHHRPDLVLVAGGTDSGAEDKLLQLMETVHIGALVLNESKPPHILFAGNKNARERIREIVGSTVHLYVADNVRPTLDSEQLADARRAIHKLYETLKIDQLPGIKNVREWEPASMMPTAQALANVTRYFATVQNGRTLTVDLGSDSVTLAEAVDDKPTQLYVRSDLGMGRPLSQLLDKVSLSDIARWLPSPMDEETIHNFIQHKALYPQTIPITDVELNLEQVLARAILHCALEGMEMGRSGAAPGSEQPLRLLLIRGRTLTSYPRASQTLLALLDTLQPTGIFSVAVDAYGVLPALGVLTEREPMAAVQTSEGGLLTNLGWVVAPTGRGQPGQKALHIVMEGEDEQRLEVEVEYGTIETLPLASNQSATVTLKPERRFDIGLGPGKGQTVTIRGGSVGLVIDARGRPLKLPSDNADRQALLQQWKGDIGG
jgi:uncharacterized protein (TIGR01319 family)